MWENSTTKNALLFEKRESILNITKILGIKLTSDSQEICLRLDAALVLDNKTPCFRYELSSATDNLRNFYIETFEKNNTIELPNLHYFTDKIQEFSQLDFYLFLKCIYVLLEKIDDDELGYFIGIVEEVINQDFKNRHVHLLAKKLFGILYELEADFVMSSSSLMLASWTPSTKNISGLLFYKNTTIEEIVTDKNIENLELNNIEIAGYIPSKFLKKLQENSEYSNIRIKMIFTIEAGKFKDILNISVSSVKTLIGISIPGFCKTENYAILTAYFGSLFRNADWTNFGDHYLDSTNNIANRRCILDEISFFGPKINQIVFYESVKEIYCLSAVFKGLKYEQTRVGQTAYPQKFCVNDKLNIPVAKCENNSTFRLLDENTDCLEIAESKMTETLYKTLVNCTTTNSICDVDKFSNYAVDDLKVFIDIKLYFDIFIYFKLEEASAEEIQELCQVFGKGITLLENQNRTGFLNILVLYFLHSLPKNYVNEILIQPNYIYQKVLDLPSHNETRGIAIFLGNNAMSIKNTTNLRKIAKNHNTHAIIYILRDNQTLHVSEETFLTINIVVIRNYRLSEVNFGCSSVMVALHHSSRQHERIKFSVFLRNLNDPKNGYWGLVESERKMVKLVCLRQSDKKNDVELVVDNRGVFTVLHAWSSSNVLQENYCIILYAEILLYLFLLNWIMF